LGARVIMSAHGVALRVREHAALRQLEVFDATCPLVTKVHVEVKKLRADGYEIVMIGHSGHPEVEGTMGQTDTGMYLVEDVQDVETLEVKTPEKIAYVSQTTLSVDDTQVIVGALQKKISCDSGAQEKRYLLRHSKPAGCGQRYDQAC